jgi:hypothetical protein
MGPSRRARLAGFKSEGRGTDAKIVTDDRLSADCLGNPLGCWLSPNGPRSWLTARLFGRTARSVASGSAYGLWLDFRLTPRLSAYGSAYGLRLTPRVSACGSVEGYSNRFGE